MKRVPDVIRAHHYGDHVDRADSGDDSDSSDQDDCSNCPSSIGEDSAYQEDSAYHCHSRPLAVSKSQRALTVDCYHTRQYSIACV